MGNESIIAYRILEDTKRQNADVPKNCKYFINGRLGCCFGFFWFWDLWDNLLKKKILLVLHY